jgi:hypothetical protein
MGIDYSTDSGDSTTDLGGENTDMGGEATPLTDMAGDSSVNESISDSPGQSDDSAPLSEHPRPGTTVENRPEFPPNLETETIPVSQEQEGTGALEGEGGGFVEGEGSLEPPEGWRPGGPEAGW